MYSFPRMVFGGEKKKNSMECGSNSKKRKANQTVSKALIGQHVGLVADLKAAMDDPDLNDVECCVGCENAVSIYVSGWLLAVRSPVSLFCHKYFLFFLKFAHYFHFSYLFRYFAQCYQLTT